MLHTVLLNPHRSTHSCLNLPAPDPNSVLAPRPRDDWFDKPFFETGKLIGDKRATVAEKGFNRPLKRVLVSAGGMLQ